MKMIELTCKNCGANVRISSDRQYAFCEYCGTELAVDILQSSSAEDIGYQFEKGRQRAQSEKPKSSRKKNIIFWILGWIFIFPIPVYLLLKRSNGISKTVKVVLTATACAVYLFVLLSPIMANRVVNQTESNAIMNDDITNQESSESANEFESIDNSALEGTEQNPESNTEQAVVVDTITQGSDTIENISAKSLQIVESGYDISFGYLYGSIVLYNPTDKVIECPSYRVTAKDSSGSVIGTNVEYGCVVYPKQEVKYVFQDFEADESPVKVIFETLEPEYYFLRKPSELPHATYSPLETSNVTKKSSGFTGEVYNPNNYDISLVAVAVFFRDSEGTLKGGTMDFLENVKANSRTPFQISEFCYDNLEKDNYELYAGIWSLY